MKRENTFKMLGIMRHLAQVLILTLVWAKIGFSDLSALEREYGVKIDLLRIAQIESSNDPLAFNKKERAFGLYQIRNPLLADWNASHPKEMYYEGQLFNPDVNRKLAEWYLTDRIPKMLRFYGKHVTTENILIAYNAGIAYVVYEKELPKITKRYLEKYFNGRNEK